MQSKGASLIAVGLLTGLPASTTVEASVYSGFGCDDSKLGSAYSSATALTTDADGTVDVDMNLAGGAAASKSIGSFPPGCAPHPPPHPTVAAGAPARDWWPRGRPRGHARP